VSGPDLRELVEDLEAEQTELDDVVAPLDDRDWWRPTPAEGWRVADQIHHLAYFDRAGALAITDPEAFVAHRRALGKDPGGFERERRAEVERLGPDVLGWWRSGRDELLNAVGQLPPGARLPWYGPSMSGPSFVTARLMETWAHGVDIGDALGRPPGATARLRHVAHLGVRTRRFSYDVRARPAPEVDARVELVAPDGGVWQWGPSGAPDRVAGPALDFCLVVTQRRHPAATALVATGPSAAEWIRLAQAFAGPPGPGRPAPTDRSAEQG